MTTKKFFENILTKWQDVLSHVGTYIAIPTESGLIVRYTHTLFEEGEVTITTTVSFSRNVEVLEGADGITFRIFHDEKCTNIVHFDPIEAIGRTELREDELGDIDCMLMGSLMELIGIDWKDYSSLTFKDVANKMEYIIDKYGDVYDLTTEEGIALAQEDEANERANSFANFIKGIIDKTLEDEDED